MSEQTVKALRHRAEQLALLNSVESFGVLRDECEKKAGQIGDQLKVLLLAAGETAPVDQRLVDYNRGFVAGMRYATTGVPSGAARTLQRLEGQAVAETDEPEEDFWSYEQPD